VLKLFSSSLNCRIVVVVGVVVVVAAVVGGRWWWWPAVGGLQANYCN
jgi:hypothetical protein